MMWFQFYGNVSIELMLPLSFQKWDRRISLLFAHVLEVGTLTLKAPLNALQGAGAHAPSPHCLLALHARTLDTETQLFQTTRLVAVSSATPELNPLDYWFWGACKDSVYRNKLAGAWRSCVSVSSSTCVKCQQTPRRGCMGASSL